MPKPQPKKQFQVQRMFGLATPKAQLAGLKPQEYIETLIGQMPTVRAERISMLSFTEANDVITALGGDPFRSYGGSKRNENYKKQSAGIKTVETEAHVIAIREAAALRNMGEEGIASLAGRMHLPWPPHTTEQGNKIFEALKAMNKRDNIVAFPKRAAAPAAAAAEPKFRRVA